MAPHNKIQRPSRNPSFWLCLPGVTLCSQIHLTSILFQNIPMKRVWMWLILYIYSYNKYQASTTYPTSWIRNHRSFIWWGFFFPLHPDIHVSVSSYKPVFLQIVLLDLPTDKEFALLSYTSSDTDVRGKDACAILEPVYLVFKRLYL